jgi:hypothetical protein
MDISVCPVKKNRQDMLRCAAGIFPRLVHTYIRLGIGRSPLSATCKQGAATPLVASLIWTHEMKMIATSATKNGGVAGRTDGISISTFLFSSLHPDLDSESHLPLFWK